MSAHLSREQCLRLLSTVTAGRVVVYHHALPVIRPVPFRLIEETLVIPVLPGGRIALAALRGDVVAFEADRVDTTDGMGWSVVVTGVPTAVAHAKQSHPALAWWTRTGRTTALQLPVNDVIGRLGSVVWA